jgi:hypothetical protein
MNFFVIKKKHFYKGFKKKSYKKNIKLMIKKWEDNNLLDTPKEHNNYKNVEF